MWIPRGCGGTGALALALSVALPAALLLAVGAAGDTWPGNLPTVGIPFVAGHPRSRLPHLALPASRRLRGGGNAASRFQYALDVARREVDGGWEDDFDFDGEEEEEEAEDEADSEEERQLRAMAATRRRMASAAAAKEEEEEEDNAAPGAKEQRDRPKAESPKISATVSRADFTTGHDFDYDLIVIGGGSGGLACSKEAARLGARVAVCDFVTPTPLGTTWGLGGTCVNVGCIPKKLMHKASLLGDGFTDAESYGWKVPEKVHHSWEAMVGSVQDHIASLNFGYRTELRSKNVTYLNELASFLDGNTIECVDGKGKARKVTAASFVIAVGGRPKYPGVPGDKELCITSDDLFSLPKSPGKTLVVGASYVALECAGFITGLGLNSTVMMRSIPLRGFDQDCAERVCQNMELHGTRFLRRCVPEKFERASDKEGGGIKVTWSGGDETSGGGAGGTEVFDTVILAIGRYAVTESLKLSSAGVTTVKGSLKIAGTGQGVGAEEGTEAKNLFAIGDVLEGRPELTPVAIKAGTLLARRLFGGASERMDYTHVATTVFTPLEYSCVGLSEEEAREKYGEESGGGGLDIYAQVYRPLEWQLPAMAYPTIPGRGDATCYVKVLASRAEAGKVVGVHIVGDCSGEMIQGFALAMKLGATKDDFDGLVGVHPTGAEALTTMGDPVLGTGELELKGC